MSTVRTFSAATGSLSDPLIGSLVAGRYRIRSRLGSGGMAVVYEVEHVELGKRFAMKLLKGPLNHDPNVVRRFKREAMLASQLSNPHTVQVFDYGSTDGLTWLVMQLVEGRTLSRAMHEDGPLAPERVACIVAGVASSLTEAHALEIVHRDIKPGNIMLSESLIAGEIATVVDFGLALIRGNQRNDISTKGIVVGTPAYMAPEQAQGEEVDARTDIYALGAVMYRALTGELPIWADSLPELCARQVSDQPTPPHQRVPELAIPVALSEIVMRALEKDPAKRWASAADFRRAVLEGSSDWSSENIAFPLIRPSSHPIQLAHA